MGRFLLLAATAAAALWGPGVADAANPKLIGKVGPGFEISLTNEAGQRVTQLDPGTYDLVVTDESDSHNFNLSGPGVDERTDVGFTGTRTFTVTLKEGNYVYECNVHATMTGRFTVGNPPPPPPPPPTPTPAAPGKLTATVGPSFVISLKTALGAIVRSVKAGAFTITVRDRSNFHNFHLVGPGVNKSTGVAFKGTTTWKVKFAKGKTYRFFCDPHKTSLKGFFRAT